MKEETYQQYTVQEAAGYAGAMTGGKRHYEKRKSQISASYSRTDRTALFRRAGGGSGYGGGISGAGSVRTGDGFRKIPGRGNGNSSLDHSGEVFRAAGSGSHGGNPQPDSCCTGAAERIGDRKQRGSDRYLCGRNCGQAAFGNSLGI